MIKAFKRYRLRKEEEQLAVTLEALYQKAQGRRDSNKSNEFLSFYDYFTEPEQSNFSKLAFQHYDLCLKLDKSSPYFAKHRDPWRNEPNSPKGMTTVDQDVSTKIEYWRSPLLHEDGQYREFIIRNGELDLYGNYYHSEADKANVVTFYEIWKSLD